MYLINLAIIHAIKPRLEPMDVEAQSDLCLRSSVGLTYYDPAGSLGPTATFEKCRRPK